jgi:hypothetical protein
VQCVKTDVVVHLFVSTEDAVTLVASVVLDQKYASTINIKHRAGYVLRIYFVVIIDKNIIVGNVFQKNFAFTTIGLVNVKNVNGMMKNNKTMLLI